MEEGSKEHEDVLVNRLRSLCNKQGKEIFPKKCAQLFHQLGLIYRKRSPDKISLVKCVGLLNAAIVRKPHNATQIESDLSEVCQHILKLADTKNQSADMIAKAKEVYAEIEQLRATVNRFLDDFCAEPIPLNVEREELKRLQTNKIYSIQQINQIITKQYAAIMANVMKSCENLMGKPPCQYAVVGMGSLARKEITPFSDFEHITV